MGEHNWFFPRWLDKITPHLSIEGGEFFAERDRAAAVAPAREPEPAAT
jgi:RND superfamily putative drug exporter